MENLESIKSRIEAAVPGSRVTVVADAGPAAQHSLWLNNEHVREVALFLRDDPQLRLDYASNVSGVDWPDKVVKETIKTKQVIEGVEREIQETKETTRPGYLEAVY